MKVHIENGRIVNFVDDNYISGNKDVIPQEIKGFSPDVDQEEVAKNNTRVKGCFIYYLEKGIVMKLKLEEQPEYAEYQSRQRAAAYTAESDALFFKYQRGEVTEKEWLDKVQEIKDRFPY